MCKEKGKKICLVLLAAAQFALCILALVLPELFMGIVSKENAENFLEGAHEEEDNYPTNPTMIEIQIGFFESIINRTIHYTNREGLVGVFGFSLLATLSSFFTLIYSIQLLCSCGESCGNVCKCISDKLKKLTKSNYSTGMSSVIVAAMTGFSASDLEGGNVGANFYLQVCAAICSALISLGKALIKGRNAGEVHTEPNVKLDYF